MLNSSRRAETDYLPSLCKFYEGWVQSHVAFPSISLSSDTLQPFGCCTRTRTVHGELRSPPRAQRFATRRAHWCHGPWPCNSHYRPQQRSCLPQLHLRQQKTAGPSPRQRRRGILQWKDPAPLTTSNPSPQCWGSTAPPSPSPMERARAGDPAHHEHVCSRARLRKRNACAYCKQFSLQFFVSEQLYLLIKTHTVFSLQIQIERERGLEAVCCFAMRFLAHCKSQTFKSVFDCPWRISALRSHQITSDNKEYSKINFGRCLYLIMTEEAKGTGHASLQHFCTWAMEDRFLQDVCTAPAQCRSPESDTTSFKVITFKGRGSRARA